MDSDPERIPVRARRGQRPAEGIVDDLLHRAPLAMHGILEEPGHVRIKRQGGAHTDIIVSEIEGIKMSQWMMRLPGACLQERDELGGLVALPALAQELRMSLPIRYSARSCRSRAASVSPDRCFSRPCWNRPSKIA